MAAVVLLALLVRCGGIDRPLLGHYATRNVVNAMMARNWAQGEASFWRPTLDALAGGQPAWIMVELPVAAYAAGALWHYLGGSLDAWGRCLSIALSLGSTWLLMLLVARWHGQRPALVAGLVLALAPVSVVVGQSFLLESSLVFGALAALLAMERYLAGRGRWWLLGCAAMLSLVLLTKIYMLVLFLPLCTMVWQTQRRVDVLALTALALAAAPAVLWYADAYLAAAGADAQRLYYSVRHSVADHAWPHPLLTDPDFYARLARTLASSALTPLGALLAAVGLLHQGARRHWPWLLAMAVLLVALPRKFDEQPYYWLVVLPPLCVLAGLGWQRIETYRPLPRWAAPAMLVAAVGLSLRLSIGPAYATPEEDRAVLPAAAAVRELAGAEERVITMHGSTLDLLYYCQRRGWGLSPHDEELSQRVLTARRQGAAWMVVVDSAQPDVTPLLERAAAPCEMVRSQPGWRIYRLLPPTSETRTARR